MPNSLNHLNSNLLINDKLTKPGLVIYKDNQPELNYIKSAIGEVFNPTFATFTDYINNINNFPSNELIVVTNIEDNCLFQKKVTEHTLPISNFLYFEHGISQLTDSNFEKQYSITKSQANLMTSSISKLRTMVNIQLENKETFFYQNDFVDPEELKILELFTSIFIECLNNKYSKKSILWVMNDKITNLLYEDNPNYGLYSQSRDGLGVYTLSDNSSFRHDNTPKLSKLEIFQRYQRIFENLDFIQK
jgi:hypothetical protein